MYRPISRRLALTGYYIRWYFVALHLGVRQYSRTDGTELSWCAYPSLASLAVSLTDWTLLRVHVTTSHGSRPGGLPFTNGKTMARVSVVLSLSVLCLTLSVRLYRNRDRDVR